MARGVTALSFALLLALFEIGSCLRCKQCNSQNDPTCADPYASAKPSVECSSQDSINYNAQNLQALLPANSNVAGAVPRYCHKIITETGTVIRACLDANTVNMNATCELLDNGGRINENKKIRYCSACNKDDCNGASTAIASLPLALTLLASYLYFK